MNGAITTRGFDRCGLERRGFDWRGFKPCAVLLRAVLCAQIWWSRFCAPGFDRIHDSWNRSEFHARTCSSCDCVRGVVSLIHCTMYLGRRRYFS